MTDRVTISIVIVNFNGGSLLTDTVRAALRSTVPVDITVVDNGSSDDSLEILNRQLGSDSRVYVITNNKNVGFAQANNRGLMRASGDYLVVLNPDCLVEPDTFERVIQAMEQSPRAGMAGCLIRNPDGTEQAGCRRSIPSPWRSMVRVLHLDKYFPNHPKFRSFVLVQEPLPSEPSFVEAISGAFMLIRREAMEKVGLFDPGYFLHCEDLDWCVRFREAGWQILFVPDAEAVHIKGACSYRHPVRVLWHMHKGMVRFYWKFFRRRYPAGLMALVVSAVWCRFVLLAGRACLLPRRDMIHPVSSVSGDETVRHGVRYHRVGTQAFAHAPERLVESRPLTSPATDRPHVS